MLSAGSGYFGEVVVRMLDGQGKSGQAFFIKLSSFGGVQCVSDLLTLWLFCGEQSSVWRNVMYMLGDKSSLSVYWEDMMFVEASLLAVPETVGLALSVTAHLAGLEGIEARDKASMRGLVQARARASVVDAVLDDGVRDVQSDLLNLVRQDRKDRRYEGMFKKGLGKAIATTSLLKQIVEVERIVGALDLPVYEDNFRDKQVGYLEPLLVRGREALLASDKAEKGRVVNRIQIDDWKHEANVVRMDVYGRLVLIAAEQGKSKKWVRAFFPAASSKAKKKVKVVAESGGGE